MSKTEKRSELQLVLDQVLAYSSLTKRKLAQKSGLAPETLSRFGKRGTADFSTIAKMVRSAGMELKVEPFARSKDSHARLDARSLALHALVAGKLSADPSLLESKVRPNIARFRNIHKGSGTEPLLREWEAAAKKGVLALLQVCVDPSEHAQQLRQASPLSGILSEAERKSVYDAYAA